MLIYSLFIIFKFKKTYSCITSSLCFGILIGTLLIPIFYYAYTLVLGKDMFILDIGIFILNIIIAFWLSYKLTLFCRLEPYTFLFGCLVCVLFRFFVLFTYRHSEARIFEVPTISQNT